MVNTENESYDMIVNYIQEHKDMLGEVELKFLLRYARSLKERNYHNQPTVSIISVLEDMKALNEKIKSGDLTSLSFDRLQREMELFDALLSSKNIDAISYELDRLYIENDMGARANSSLSYQLNKVKDLEEGNRVL